MDVEKCLFLDLPLMQTHTMGRECFSAGNGDTQASMSELPDSDPFITPRKTKKQGLVFMLDHIRSQICCHVSKTLELVHL